MNTVYLIGPMTGLTFGECADKFTSLARHVEAAGYRALHPMHGKVAEGRRSDVVLATDNAYRGPSSDASIFAKDKWCVEQADIILCDLTDHERVSIGTCFELAFAAARFDKLILVVGLEDESPMDHAFVRGAGSLFFDRMGEALAYLRSMTNVPPLPWDQDEDDALIALLVEGARGFELHDAFPMRSVEEISERVNRLAGRKPVLDKPCWCESRDRPVLFVKLDADT